MNQLLERIYRTGTVITADGQELEAFPMGIDRPLAEALYRIVRENNLQCTLEIGMAYGLSSLAICQALRDNGGGRHIAIDPGQSSWCKSIGMLNLRRAELADVVEIYEQPSHLVLPEFLRQGRTFEFIFIDGSHLYDYISVDFFYSRFLIPVNGLICMDDLGYPAVYATLAFAVKNLQVLSVIEHTKRYCVLKRVKAEDDRPWDHFVPF